VSKKRQISMFQPFVAEAAIGRVTDVLRSRWIGQGPLVDEFEKALERRLKLANAVAVNAASSALRIALSIAGVKPGDEVIATPMTCTLTNHPILEQFAVPVFADIQYETGNIDPSDIEPRITSRTRAILCTHWGGAPSDLEEINEIGRRHELPVIEDASEAIGATYRGQPVGNISRFTAFSFQAIQILTTGEGGLLTTTSPEDAERARVQRWYGIDRKGRKANTIGYYDFDIAGMGFGYHLTNIAAAIGLGNLEHLNEALERRRKIAASYREELSDTPGVVLLKSPEDRQPSNHWVTVHVERRDDFCRKLRERGIETSIVHARNDLYTAFGGRREDLPNLDRFDRTYIALPCHLSIDEEDVAYLTETIREGW
jgi:perosamine synthetase